jgi:hypothetical protein
MARQQQAMQIGAPSASFKAAVDRLGNPVVSVVIDRDEATDSVMGRLNSLPELETLELQDYASGLGRRNDWRVTDAGVSHLRRLTRLHRLSLPSSRVTDAGLAVLAEMPQLEELAIGNPSGYVHPGRREPTTLEETLVANISDAGLERLAGLPRLRSLTLFGTRVTNDGLSLLTRFRLLRHLSIVLVNGGVTERGFVHLAKLTRLRSLAITDLSYPSTDAMTAGLSELTKLGVLESLNIFSMRVNDDALESIGKLQSLRNLSLYHAIATMPVTDLGLERLKGLGELRTFRLGIHRISDQGLAAISTLGKLETIEVSSLTRSTISDTGLQQLSRLSSLKSLRLPPSRDMTSSGLERLHKSLPQLVVHDPSP